MDALLPEIREQGGDRLGLRNEEGGTDVAGYRLVASALSLEADQVLCVGDADHVIDGVEIDGQP